MAKSPITSKFSLFRFLQQTRSEVSKIVWPTRRELLVTTGMVLLMSAIAAIFFFLVDQVIAFGLTYILNAF